MHELPSGLKIAITQNLYSYYAWQKSNNYFKVLRLFVKGFLVRRQTAVKKDARGRKLVKC